MAAKLTKVINREISVEDIFGKIGDIVVTIRPNGLQFRKKGSKKRKLIISWEQIAKKIEVPGDAPAKFSCNPFGWLIE